MPRALAPPATAHRSGIAKMARFFQLSALATALLLAAGPAATATEKLPSGFKLCHVDDENSCFEEALAVAAHQLISGLPDFGIPPLEPLHIPQLNIGDPNSNSPVNLQINITDILIYNLKDAKPSKVNFDFEKDLLTAHERVENIHGEANYVMGGRILLIPAQGEGKVTFNLTNLESDITMKGEKNVKKNNDHMRVTDFSFNITHLEKLDMHFDNLFNGDQTLGTSVNNLINENWMELWSQIKDPLQEIFGYTFREYARRIFDKVPLENIFLRHPR